MSSHHPRRYSTHRGSNYKNDHRARRSCSGDALSCPSLCLYRPDKSAPVFGLRFSFALRASSCSSGLSFRAIIAMLTLRLIFDSTLFVWECLTQFFNSRGSHFGSSQVDFVQRKSVKFLKSFICNFRISERNAVARPKISNIFHVGVCCIRIVKGNPLVEGRHPESIGTYASAEVFDVRN